MWHRFVAFADDGEEAHGRFLMVPVRM